MCLSFAGMDESDKRRIKNCKRFTEERGRLLLYTGFLVRYTCLYFINIYDVFSIMYGSGGGVLDTTLCDKDCQWLVAGWWFSPGVPVSSTNKTDRHHITEILLKVD